MRSLIVPATSGAWVPLGLFPYAWRSGRLSACTAPSAGTRPQMLRWCQYARVLAARSPRRYSSVSTGLSSRQEVARANSQAESRLVETSLAHGQGHQGWWSRNPRRPGARGRFRLLPVALHLAVASTRPMETRRRRTSVRSSASTSLAPGNKPAGRIVAVSAPFVSPNSAGARRHGSSIPLRNVAVWRVPGPAVISGRRSGALVAM